VTKTGIEKNNNAVPAVSAGKGTRNYIITVNNQAYNVSVVAVDSLPGTAPASGGITVTPVAAAAPEKEGTDVEAPTPGTIIKILVDIGARVVANQPLVIMEAMKMESEVNAPCDGKILAIHVTAGDSVQASEPLFTIG
jgi:pyruvate carboxylase subunit B